jgi:hypothetical protein
MESVNYKLVQENSKLKDENQNLINEYLRYERIKQAHKEILSILRGTSPLRWASS